jgi:hypothetical protein
VGGETRGADDHGDGHEDEPVGNGRLKDLKIGMITAAAMGARPFANRSTR